MNRTNGAANGVKKYRKVLLGRKSDLLSGLRGKRDALTAAGSTALEDLAPELHDQFITLQLNQLDSLQLKLIEAALARMDCKNYGVCEDCGEAISPKRLDAIPWAVHCIACQELLSAVSDESEAVSRYVRGSPLKPAQAARSAT
jgi:DnaK suppressor protein